MNRDTKQLADKIIAAFGGAEDAREAFFRMAFAEATGVTDPVAIAQVDEILGEDDDDE